MSSSSRVAPLRAAQAPQPERNEQPMSASTTGVRLRWLAMATAIGSIGDGMPDGIWRRDSRGRRGNCPRLGGARRHPRCYRPVSDRQVGAPTSRSLSRRPRTPSPTARSSVRAPRRTRWRPRPPAGPRSASRRDSMSSSRCRTRQTRSTSATAFPTRPRAAASLRRWTSTVNGSLPPDHDADVTVLVAIRPVPVRQ